jgi:hypothetical protein
MMPVFGPFAVAPFLALFEYLILFLNLFLVIFEGFLAANPKLATELRGMRNILLVHFNWGIANAN